MKPSEIPVKSLLAIACFAVFASSVQADTVFACQEMAANGFDFRNKKWEKQAFAASRRFFLKIGADGVLDKASAFKGATGLDRGSFDRCEMPATGAGEIHTCADMGGSYLTFNQVTGEGASAALTGAVSPSFLKNQNYRDSIVVALFVCQRM